MCARPMLLFGDRVQEVLNGEQKTNKQTKNWGAGSRRFGVSALSVNCEVEAGKVVSARKAGATRAQMSRNRKTESGRGRGRDGGGGATTRLRVFSPHKQLQRAPNAAPPNAE